MSASRVLLGALPPAGIPYVLVNGTIVVRAGQIVDGVTLGRPIRAPAHGTWRLTKDDVPPMACSIALLYSTGGSVIQLRDKDTDQVLGTIDDDDLRFLVDELEEESPTDQDYYFDPDTIDMLEDDGAPASLVALLRNILGTRDGMEIRWERQ